MNKKLLIVAGLAVVAGLMVLWAIPSGPGVAQPKASGEPSRPLVAAGPLPASQGSASEPAPGTGSAASVASAAASSTALPLLTQVQLALANRDGRRAEKLSGTVGFCKHVSDTAEQMHSSMRRQGVSISSDSTEYWQRKQAQCQTIPAGQADELQRQLLQLAKDQQIPGAAASLWELTYKRDQVADAADREQIFRDAIGGNLGSLVIAVVHAGLRISPEDQEVLRRGIQRAGMQARDQSALGIFSKTVASIPMKDRPAFTAAQIEAMDRRAVAVAAALLAHQND